MVFLPEAKRLAGKEHEALAGRLILFKPARYGLSLTPDCFLAGFVELLMDALHGGTERGLELTLGLSARTGIQVDTQNSRSIAGNSF
jgi:hypothetical protein